MDFGFDPDEGPSGLVGAGDESVDVGDEFGDAGSVTLAKDAPSSDLSAGAENQISMGLSREAGVGV